MRCPLRERLRRTVATLPPAPMPAAWLEMPDGELVPMWNVSDLVVTPRPIRIGERFRILPP